jgi:AspT/YidE/YbjL antiporter-like protein
VPHLSHSLLQFELVAGPVLFVEVGIDLFGDGIQVRVANYVDSAGNCAIGIPNILYRSDYLFNMEEFTNFNRLLELLHSQPVLTLFLILGMGYLIGAIRIGSFSLGPVAGVLFAGLFLGNFDFRISAGAQSVGFALFIFSVGYQAGPVLILAGIMVTIIPIFVGYLFGRKVLKIHPVLLFGGITGSMTSGAALSVVTKAANSHMPSLGYTGAYAFANVLLTIAGSIILFF